MSTIHHFLWKSLFVIPLKSMKMSNTWQRSRSKSVKCRDVAKHQMSPIPLVRKLLSRIDWLKTATSQPASYLMIYIYIYIVTCRGCERLIRRVLYWTTGFIDTLLTQLGTTGNYSIIADLHTFQFTVPHALGFLVFTSHILATELSQAHCHFKSTHR
jgi:hypothetical protein